jgi:hypothetical protein
MFALLLTAAAAGYGLRQHSDLTWEDGMLEAHLNLGAFWTDICRAWAAFLTICAFTITTAHTVRIFTDTVALPWIRAFGFQVPALPTLPALPTQDRLTA